MKAINKVVILFICLFAHSWAVKADESIYQNSGYVGLYGYYLDMNMPWGNGLFPYQSNKIYIDIADYKLVQLNFYNDLEGTDYVKVYDINNQGNQHLLSTITSGSYEIVSTRHTGRVMVEFVADNDGVYDESWEDYYNNYYYNSNYYSLNLYNGVYFTFSEMPNSQSENALFSKSMILERGMQAEGYVGVGTTNPDAAVTVKGKMHVVGGVSVVVSAPADYVFDPNYPLKNLVDVEQYIKQNSHLPDVPSAKEIVKGGLTIGDMQNKLLQKIEELTLYLIQQQKEIDQLEKQLNKRP